MGLATGARRGEITGLKWQDLDLARGAFAVRRSLEQTQAGVTEKSPKNGKSRVVMLPDSAVALLRQHRLALAKTRVPSHNDYIFPNVDASGVWLSEPWTPHKITDGFREICRKAKVVGASFHTLRHTCASLMLAQGVHPKIVQEMLGHSSISGTLDLYSHTTPSLQCDAAKLLDGVLSNSLGSVYASA